MEAILKHRDNGHLSWKITLLLFWYSAFPLSRRPAASACSWRWVRPSCWRWRAERRGHTGWSWSCLRGHYQVSSCHYNVSVTSVSSGGWCQTDLNGPVSGLAQSPGHGGRGQRLGSPHMGTWRHRQLLRRRAVNGVLWIPLCQSLFNLLEKQFIA